MTRKVRIIQLAAYHSNLGDNANLRGTRKMLRQNLHGMDVEFTDWEILDYSWGLDHYTQDTIDWVNSHDLLIIGGGGFLEIINATDCWTGTRIAIPEELFKKITIPVVLHGVGTPNLRTPDPEPLQRFKNFIDLLYSSDQYLVSTRNDGSQDTFRRLLGDEYADRLDVIPDGGFFTEVDDHTHPELNPSGRTIAINFGGDLLDIRLRETPDDLARIQAAHDYGDTPPPPMPSDYEGYKPSDNVPFDRFLAEMKNVLVKMFHKHPDINVVFVPHIYRDIEMGYDFLHSMGFPYCRRRMTMAPYLHGDEGQSYIFDLYKKCDLAIGMRFHLNVCCVGLGTPTIGIGTFVDILELYRELGMEDRVLNANNRTFMTDFEALLEQTLSDPDAVRARYAEKRKELVAQINAFHAKIRALLERSYASELTV